MLQAQGEQDLGQHRVVARGLGELARLAGPGQPAVEVERREVPFGEHRRGPRPQVRDLVARTLDELHHLGHLRVAAAAHDPDPGVGELDDRVAPALEIPPFPRQREAGAGEALAAVEVVVGGAGHRGTRVEPEEPVVVEPLVAPIAQRQLVGGDRVPPRAQLGGPFGGRHAPAAPLLHGSQATGGLQAAGHVER